MQKDRVRRSIRRAAQAQGCDAETVERLVLEAGERLEDDDIHAALATHAVDEIVALICSELGLEADNSTARPPPLAGEVPEGAEGACGRRTFRSSAPDG